MKEKNKNQGHVAIFKRRTFYYILLGVCVLVLSAAIVITVMAATGRFSMPINDIEKNNPTDSGSEDPSNPTGAETISFSNPIANMDVIVANEFWHDPTLDYWYTHEGIDFKGDVGENVYSVLDGKVESVVKEDDSSAEVIIDHGNSLKSVYKCIGVADTLSKGVVIKKGDAIGQIVETQGNQYKEGPHLHFSVLLDNKEVDPESYLTLSEK